MSMPSATSWFNHLLAVGRETPHSGAPGSCRPVNALVVEPGRYSFGDFVKVGVPFTLVVLVVSVLLVPVLLPF